MLTGTGQKVFQSFQVGFTWTCWPLLLKRKEQNMAIKEGEEKKFCKSRTSSLNVHSGSSAFACSNGKLIEKQTQTIRTTSVTFLKWAFFPPPSFSPIFISVLLTAPLLSYRNHGTYTPCFSQGYRGSLVWVYNCQRLNGTVTVFFLQRFYVILLFSYQILLCQKISKISTVSTCRNRSWKLCFTYHLIWTDDALHHYSHSTKQSNSIKRSQKTWYTLLCNQLFISMLIHISRNKRQQRTKCGQSLLKPKNLKKVICTSEYW